MGLRVLIRLVVGLLVSGACLLSAQQGLADPGVYRDVTVYAKVMDKTRNTPPNASPNDPSDYTAFVVIRDSDRKHAKDYYRDAVVTVNGVACVLDTLMSQDYAAQFAIPDKAVLRLAPGKAVEVKIVHRRFAAPLVLDGVIPPNPVNLIIDKPLDKPNKRASVVLNMEVPKEYGLSGLAIGGTMSVGSKSSYKEGWGVNTLPFTLDTTLDGEVCHWLRLYGKYDVFIYFPTIGPSSQSSYLRLLSRLTNEISNQ